MSKLIEFVLDNDISEVLRWIEYEISLNQTDHQNRSALTWAIQGGRKEIALALIQAGADVNIKTKNGATALHWAAIYSDMELINALVAENADLNAKGRYSVWHPYKNALTKACSVNSSKVAHQLLQFGCEFDICGARFQLPSQVSILAQNSLDQLDQVRSLLSDREWPETLIAEIVDFILHEENMKRAISNNYS